MDMIITEGRVFRNQNSTDRIDVIPCLWVLACSSLEDRNILVETLCLSARLLALPATGRTTVLSSRHPTSPSRWVLLDAINSTSFEDIDPKTKGVVFVGSKTETALLKFGRSMMTTMTRNLNLRNGGERGSLVVRETPTNLISKRILQMHDDKYPEDNQDEEPRN
jgi:hypothetical protein